MRGVSEVIAIILILMITISLAGLAYMFMSTTMADVTSSAGSTVDTTTSSMITSFTIESIDIAKVYVRNTGQNTITSLSVYINDAPADIRITPSTISPGAVGTITIYDFIAEGDTIKITSPSGFSTSKKAPDPCSKSVGCWKFDEGSGTVAYDSSPYGNTGTLVNSPTWTTGKYGGAVLLNGVNDYVNIPDSSSLRSYGSNQRTMEFWAKFTGISSTANILMMGHSTTGSWFIVYGYITNFRIRADTSAGALDIATGITFAEVLNSWHHFSMVYNSTHLRFYMDGVERATPTVLTGNFADVAFATKIDHNTASFNGTIDEVRIYNRAIY
jgi:flagellin-like protein